MSTDESPPPASPPAPAQSAKRKPDDEAATTAPAPSKKQTTLTSFFKSKKPTEAPEEEPGEWLSSKKTGAEVQRDMMAGKAHLAKEKASTSNKTKSRSPLSRTDLVYECLDGSALKGKAAAADDEESESSEDSDVDEPQAAEPAAFDEEKATADAKKMTCPQLRIELKALSQIQTGLKAALVERLVDAQRAASVPVRKSNVTSPSTPSTRRRLPRHRCDGPRRRSGVSPLI